MRAPKLAWHIFDFLHFLLYSHTPQIDEFFFGSREDLCQNKLYLKAHANGWRQMKTLRVCDTECYVRMNL